MEPEEQQPDLILQFTSMISECHDFAFSAILYWLQQCYRAADLETPLFAASDGVDLIKTINNPTVP